MARKQREEAIYLIKWDSVIMDKKMIGLEIKRKDTIESLIVKWL